MPGETPSGRVLLVPLVGLVLLAYLGLIVWLWAGPLNVVGAWIFVLIPLTAAGPPLAIYWVAARRRRRRQQEAADAVSKAHERAFVDQVVAAVPGVRHLLGRHVAVDDGWHPYAFMSELAEFVGNALSAGSEPALGDSKRVLEVLEEALGSPHWEVRGLVSNNFIERIHCGSFVELVRAALPLKLRRALDEGE
jgi:hypothetical protein